MNTVLFLLWTAFVFVLGIFAAGPFHKSVVRMIDRRERALADRELAVAKRELALDQACDRILAACDRLTDKARATY